jgi:hypothetical protein
LGLNDQSNHRAIRNLQYAPIHKNFIDCGIKKRVIGNIVDVLVDIIVMPAGLYRLKCAKVSALRRWAFGCAQLGLPKWIMLGMVLEHFDQAVNRTMGGRADAMPVGNLNDNTIQIIDLGRLSACKILGG